MLFHTVAITQGTCITIVGHVNHTAIIYVFEMQYEFTEILVTNIHPARQIGTCRTKLKTYRLSDIFSNNNNNEIKKKQKPNQGKLFHLACGDVSKWWLQHII